MELSEIFWNDAISLADTLTIVLLLASVWLFGCIIRSRKLQKNVGVKKHPPYAPGSMWKHILMCTSTEYPWWILDVARQIQTRDFQVSLPMGIKTRSFVVGEPSTYLAVMTDSLTKKPEFLYRSFRILQDITIVTTNGPVWHSKRKACAPAFSSKQVKRMTRVTMEKTETWIRNTLVKDSSFDVGKEIIWIMLSALSVIAFEYDMTAKEREYFGEELELVLLEFTLKSASNPLRALFGWVLPERRRALLAQKRLKAFMFHIMNEYKKKENPSNGTIIQLVMESDAFPTDDEKAAQLIEFLIAGHDTTAYSISWILLSLARHPDEQRKIRKSLTSMSPEKWSSSEELQRVIKEGMRLNPVVAAGPIRTIGRDIVTSRGEVMPKGSICFLPKMLPMRHPDVFCDPDSFLPSRWENPTREMLDAFSPFSLGKQNCVGQSLAKAEISAVVGRICSEFELSVEAEGSPHFLLLLKPVGARLRARKV